jgi:hypothetical protein
VALVVRSLEATAPWMPSRRVPRCVALPLAAQATLLAAGLALVRHPDGALFTIAAAALLLLLFIGIHNAWDTVTFLVIQRLESGQDD